MCTVRNPSTSDSGDAGRGHRKVQRLWQWLKIHRLRQRIRLAVVLRCPQHSPRHQAGIVTRQSSKQACTHQHITHIGRNFHQTQIKRQTRVSLFAHTTLAGGGGGDDGAFFENQIYHDRTFQCVGMLQFENNGAIFKERFDAVGRGRDEKIICDRRRSSMFG